MQTAEMLLGVFQSVEPENGLKKKKMPSGGTVSTKQESTKAAAFTIIYLNIGLKVF